MEQWEPVEIKSKAPDGTKVDNPTYNETFDRKKPAYDTDLDVKSSRRP